MREGRKEVKEGVRQETNENGMEVGMEHGYKAIKGGGKDGLSSGE